MAAEPLNTRVSKARKNIFKYEIFPSNAMVTCVKLLDKKIERNSVFQKSVSDHYSVDFLGKSRVF